MSRGLPNIPIPGDPLGRTVEMMRAVKATTSRSSSGSRQAFDFGRDKGKGRRGGSATRRGRE